MRSLRAEYAGRSCASPIHEFESQHGRKSPEQDRTSNGDRRMLHVLPVHVASHNDGRLHPEHMYCKKTKGFYLQERQTKSKSYRIGLLFHLKGAHGGFQKCLEQACKSYHPLAQTHFDNIEGPDLDRALCTMAYYVARSLGGISLSSPL